MLKNKKLLFSLVAAAIWLIIWQVAATLLNSGLLIGIPTPAEAFKAFFGFLKTKEFYINVSLSLLRIAVGFTFGAVFGIISGVLSAKSRLFSAFVSPLVTVVRAVPVAAFIFLVYLWMKSNDIPSFIAFLMVFPIIHTSTSSAVLSIDRRLTEMAYVMGMSKLRCFFKIKLPLCMPSVSASLITAVGLAWKAGIAAEVICRPNNSLGYLLWQEKSSIQYDGVFAVSITVALLSLTLELIIKKAINGGRQK